MSDSPEALPPTVTELMPAQAEAFVQAAQAAGLLLDNLPRTLPIADKFGKSNPDEIERMAAYVGDVIRRETKGFWFEADGAPFVYVGVEPYVDARAFVQDLLANGRVDVAGISIESSKAYCELMVRLQKQWLDEAVLGNYESLTALRTSMSADAKTAGLVLGLIQTAVLMAQLDWTEALDTSTDSLDAVERILGLMHDLVAKDDGRITDVQIEALAKSMGVYVGEIIRRHYGGQWHLSPEGAFELPYANTTVDPVARARKRIIDGPSENVRMFFNSMGRVIGS